MEVELLEGELVEPEFEIQNLIDLIHPYISDSAPEDILEQLQSLTNFNEGLVSAAAEVYHNALTGYYDEDAWYEFELEYRLAIKDRKRNLEAMKTALLLPFFFAILFYICTQLMPNETLIRQAVLPMKISTALTTLLAMYQAPGFENRFERKYKEDLRLRWLVLDEAIEDYMRAKTDF